MWQNWHKASHGNTLLDFVTLVNGKPYLIDCDMHFYDDLYTVPSVLYCGSFDH
jgi:hypothetical protein